MKPWLVAWIALALQASATPLYAHSGDHASGTSAKAEVLAPGYGALGFEAPTPGSYSLPPLGPAADGAVLRSDGTPATLHGLFDEKLVLLSFIYASCGDVNGCPLATAVFHRVQKRLREEPELARHVRLLSLSFDPARDTPDVMASYGASFAGSDVDWQFLTTQSEAQLAPMLDAYGQALVRDVDASGRELGVFSHVLRVFLIDTGRRIRNTYTVSFLHPDTLVADLETLRLEAAAAAPAVSAAAAEIRPGDDRQGYESAGYRTRSLGLASRRGEPADLPARLRRAPLGLPAVPVPDDNAASPAKIALGRKLFYDRRLSLNGTFSCAMCHIPEQGFGNNEMATAVGIEGRTVRRNAPTIYNVAYLESLFHDGRETRLEHQVWGPLLASNEMGNPSIGAVLETIRTQSDYDGLFETAFPGRGLAMETVGMALASYERTLVSGDSAFDRWRYGGDETALGESARRGFALFTGPPGCASCHGVGERTALFSDGAFHNTGIGFEASMGKQGATRRVQVAPGRWLEVENSIVAQVAEPPPADLGRYEITLDPADRWKYRTPTLRNVALTGPYMHDGSLSTLREVVRFYDRGGVPNPGLDPRIRPLGLEDAEVADLVAFLEALTGGDVPLLVGDAFAAPVGDFR